MPRTPPSTTREPPPHPLPVATARAVKAIEREYLDYLNPNDRDLLVYTVFTAAREPDGETLAIFIDELTDSQGAQPDPGVIDATLSPRLTHREMRLRLTWAWRRALDRLASPYPSPAPKPPPSGRRPPEPPPDP